MTQQQGTTISVLQGYCRVGQAGTWDEARDVLRKHVRAVYWALPGAYRTSEARDAELARIDGEADQGWLWLTDSRAWASSVRYAVAGDRPRGIGEGDLAYVWDFPNGHLGWWSVSVKCKVVTIGAVFAEVRITGDSCQFRRHSVVSVPLSALRPRSHR